MHADVDIDASYEGFPKRQKLSNFKDNQVQDSYEKVFPNRE